MVSILLTLPLVLRELGKIFKLNLIAMSMKFEVDVDKKWAVGIIISLIFFAGVFFVIAYTPNPNAVVPNPGHNLTGIQAYFTGENNLNDTLGKFCQSDGTNCPSGLTGSCELIGNRNSGQQALAVDIPADKCRGKPCQVILVSSSGSTSGFAVFDYVQDVVGSPVLREWISEGGVRENAGVSSFTNIGAQADGGVGVIASFRGVYGDVYLYDDLPGTENNRDKWTLSVLNRQGAVYVC